MKDSRFFRRFPADKQGQVEQFVSYAQLMGLSGRDLISIGQFMDRAVTRTKIKQNRELAQSVDCLPVGSSRLDIEWKVKNNNGTYLFKSTRPGKFRIRSVTSGTVIDHLTNDYELGALTFDKLMRYNCLVDIALGKLTLDF